MRVFVVEDSPMYGLMVEHILKKNMNVELLRFASGEECISNLCKKPDAIILDYNLPGMDGLETLKKIKRENFSTPVVILSSQPNLNVAINLMEEGASDYICKDDDLCNELLKVMMAISYKPKSA